MKFWWFKAALVLSFGIILATVIKLNIIKGSYYRNLALNNRVTKIILPAARGEIVDRKGRKVAENIDFNGEIKRFYVYGDSMSSVTGYLGKVNEDELKNGKCGRVLQNLSVLGRSGIEKEMDCELLGTDGYKLVEVDAVGNSNRDLGQLDPVPGKEIALSIDAYWQDKIYKMLEGIKAVVIMSEPKTGKIITLVSSPSFDANNFNYSYDKETIKTYLEDTVNLPMMNRTMGAKYHPGSVFKLVEALGALEEGLISRETLIQDTGVIKIGDYSFNNWLWTKRGETDGMVNVVKALKRSNDIFFYKLGEAMGVDRIKNWAERFGFGQVTGVELPGEVAGLIPDDQWKRNNLGERWYLGDTYHLSIGQGNLTVTPLQINQMTNIVASKGQKCQMSLLKDKPVNCSEIKAKEENWVAVIEGMKEACNSGGTAWPLFNFKTEIACKTGTAELGDGTDDTHAWLTAFAPADSPEISITVLVERGGEGSDVAAPIMGDILKEWFEEPETVVPRLKE
ncbi:MAG: penicillin-binding transpeptidase domain-containing protein [Candidatus Shapirobacteria bacterium]|nr:penicillin-binding transpeptidase domain-containing protein [Candidatus Shapirobacteria bacterium]